MKQKTYRKLNVGLITLVAAFLAAPVTGSAEEGTDLIEIMMPPMLKEARRLRRDLPLAGVGEGSPCVHCLADLIDDRRRIVLLFLGRKAFALVEHDF